MSRVVDRRAKVIRYAEQGGGGCCVVNIGAGTWVESVRCGKCQATVGWVYHDDISPNFWGLDSTGDELVVLDHRIGTVRQVLRRRHRCGGSTMMGAGRGSHGGVASDQGGAAGHHRRD
jgi:hypothetical protein